MAEKALTVSALTKYIKYKFDQDKHLKDILIEGEISNFKRNIRGHFYFTLKDDKASISAVMFKSNAWKVKFTPKDGMNVLLRGYISVFEVSGSYQIYVDSMEEVGIGNLYQAYLALKEKLEKQGYFDQRHKKPLPKFPNQIAVLTSNTGAAVRDIIHIINRRYPLTKILVYPTTVQGENAKHEIVENIKQANDNPDNDVIILGRGGGSIEDLWAFNEEMVAEAIYKSSLPIISAVGHETDFTISDFVADYRAPTPSGAAEIVVPDQVSIQQLLSTYSNRLYEAQKRIITQHEKRIKELLNRYVLKDPERILQNPSKRLEYLDDKLRILHPTKRLKQSEETLKNTTKQLHKNYLQHLQTLKQRYHTLRDTLEYVSPLNIMKKGYTLTKKGNTIIKSIEQVTLEDTVTINFHDGRATALIKSKEKED